MGGWFTAFPGSPVRKLSGYDPHFSPFYGVAGSSDLGGWAQQVEIQSCTVGNPNTEDPATPWVELELNSLGASEKAIDYGNTVQ